MLVLAAACSCTHVCPRPRLPLSFARAQGGLVMCPNQHGESRLWLLHTAQPISPVVIRDMLSQVLLLHCTIHPLASEVGACGPSGLSRDDGP